jgi:hypothetical protein
LGDALRLDAVVIRASPTTDWNDSHPSRFAELSKTGPNTSAGLGEIERGGGAVFGDLIFVCAFFCFFFLNNSKARLVTRPDCGDLYNEFIVWCVDGLEGTDKDLPM